jgi:hypothetical protein
MSADRCFVALPCTLAPGIVSGERFFEVRLANGRSYQSIAPRYFCWNEGGGLVGEFDPVAEAPGKVAARVVGEAEGGQVLVEVPDGKVIAVDRSEVCERPSQILPPTLNVSEESG